MRVAVPTCVFVCIGFVSLLVACSGQEERYSGQEELDDDHACCGSYIVGPAAEEMDYTRLRNASGWFQP